MHLGIDRGDMTELTQTQPAPASRNRWDFTFAFLVLRLWLGVRALFVGIEKFGAYRSQAMPLIDPSTGQPDASGVMINVAQGLLFIALTVGLVLIDQNDGVAWLGIHVGLVAGAFLLAEYNRFAVLKKW